MDNELLRLILFLAAIGVVNDPPQLQTRMPNHVYVAVRPAGGCQRIQGTVQGQQWFVLSDGIADPVFDNSVDCALVPAASLPPAHRKRPPGARVRRLLPRTAAGVCQFIGAEWPKANRSSAPQKTRCISEVCRTVAVVRRGIATGKRDCSRTLCGCKKNARRGFRG